MNQIGFGWSAVFSCLLVQWCRRDAQYVCVDLSESVFRCKRSTRLDTLAVAMAVARWRVGPNSSTRAAYRDDFHRDDVSLQENRKGRRDTYGEIDVRKTSRFGNRCSPFQALEMQEMQTFQHMSSPVEQAAPTKTMIAG